MSTKFNRNDANVDDDKFYPDDYKTDLNGVEEDLEYFGEDLGVLPFIVTGLEVTSPTPTSPYVEISAGAARDKDNRRVAVGTTQQANLIDTGGGNNYIVLGHKYSTDTPREAYHTGTQYNTRKYDDFEITVEATKPSDKIILANVKREGGENVIYTNERTSDAPIHEQNTDTHTTEPEFYIGGPAGTGKKALKENPAPPVPTRLALATGPESDLRRSPSGGYDQAKAVDQTVPKAYIKATWGFDDPNYTGTGGPSSFTITPDPGFTDDELVGQYLIDSAGEPWTILSNTSNQLTLEESGTPSDGTFAIGPNADGYHCVLEYLNDSDQPVAIVPPEELNRQMAASPYVKMAAVWFVPVGAKVRVKVCSQGSWYQSGWSSYCSWVSITAWKSTQLVVGELTAKAKKNGMVFTWPAVDGAMKFELVLTEDGSEPDFEDESQEIIPVSSRRFQYMCEPKTKVRAKLRAVDWSGQASSNVTEAEAIAEQLTQDDIPDGRVKKSLTCAQADAATQAIPVGAEVVDARFPYRSLGEKINALQTQNIDMLYPESSTTTVDGNDAPNLPEYAQTGSGYKIKIRAPFRRALLNKRRYVEAVLLMKGTGINGFMGTAKLSVVDGAVGSEIEQYSAEVGAQSSSYSEYKVTIDLESASVILGIDAQVWLAFDGGGPGYTVTAKHIQIYAYG